MGFWIAALAVSALVALALARPLAMSRRPARSRAAHEEQVFRDQLTEIDRDLERGVLDPEEAEAARIEVSRRLLGAAAEREAGAASEPAPRRHSLALAVGLAIAAPLAALLLYSRLGSPDLPDQPLALRAEGARPSQEAAEARSPAPPRPAPEQAAERLAELETRRAAGELDRRGLYTLAQGYGALGRHRDAWRTYDALLDQGGEAPATIYAALGESMVLAAAGYVSPEAEAAFDTALRRDPENAIARYYLGAAYAQTRRPEAALEIWSRLLEESPADAPWVAPVEARIREVAERAGLPERVVSARAPAGDEQREAILGMVRSLDERLAEGAGGAEDWARLVVSYRVLGMEEEAEEARARAREALAGEADALATFEDALAAVGARLGGAPPDLAAAAPAAPAPSDGGAGAPGQARGEGGEASR